MNKVIKHDVFMMSLDKSLFINQRFLRDENGGILPVNNYLRALPYKGNKLLVVSYHVTLGDVLDLVNIGLDIALLATGHTTWGSIFLATDLLLTNDDLMQHHILYLVDKEPNAKGKYIMTRLNDAFMEQPAARRPRHLRAILWPPEEGGPPVGSQHPAHSGEEGTHSRLSP